MTHQITEDDIGYQRMHTFIAQFETRDGETETEKIEAGSLEHADRQVEQIMAENPEYVRGRTAQNLKKDGQFSTWGHGYLPHAAR